MPAQQLTTKELIDILDGRIEKAGKGPGRDAMIEQWKALQKRSAEEAARAQRATRDAQAATRQAQAALSRKQAELNSLYQSEATGKGSGVDRPRTAQDAIDEHKNRGKNPPRGDLKPSDVKKPPSGLEKAGKDSLDAIKKWGDGVKTSSAPLVNRVNNGKVGNFVKSSSANLAKAGQAIARSPVGKTAGAANKILGPLGSLITVKDAVVDLFSESPIERNTRETSEFKDGVEAALVTIITKQNRMRGMIQALAQSNQAVLASQQQLMQGLAILAQSIDTIEDYSGSTQRKLSQVNFAAIKASADNAAKIAGENKVKLGAANFTLQNQAAQLAKTKLEILDATQLMATSRLAEKKWNILDATQIMNTSRLAEKKWDILDATQLMGTSRMAETKWGILDVTQLMRYSRSAEVQLPAMKAQLTQIEAKVGKPVDLNPVLNAINTIPSKFPPPLNISGLTSQISSLANQIAGVNNSITALPNKINTKAPDLNPVLNAINNIRIPTPAPPNLSGLTNQINGLSAQITGVNGAIAAIPGKIPQPQPTNLAPVLAAINLIPSKIPAPTPTDLTPVLGAIAGIPGKIPTPNLTPINSKLDNISGVVQKIDKDNEEQKSPTTITVKVWDSVRKAIGLKSMSVPKQQAEAIQLLANESAEAQEDSHKDRAEKKSALQKIGDRLKLNQIFSALNTILTVHNAAMLSNSLIQTLGDLLSNGLAAFGFKDDAGSDLDINSIVGKQVEALLKQILGEDVYNGTKLSWQKASRVVSTAANVAWTIQSIADSTRSIMEMTAENTGRIGNALKKYRVVGENAYSWMPEDVTSRTAAQAKIDKLIEGLSGVENAASSIGSVVGDVRSIQSEVGELKTQREEFKTAIEQAVAPATPPENQPVKTAATAAKVASTGTGDIAKTTRDQAED